MLLKRWTGSFVYIAMVSIAMVSIGIVSALTMMPSNAEANAGDEPIKLESTFVGDKEQPPVSYFIPWQGVGVSNRLYRSIEGRLDNTLEPVDRDVLIRSIRVYSDMNVENR